jgi:Flp pilus assembly protein TadD
MRALAATAQLLPPLMLAAAVLAAPPARAKTVDAPAAAMAPAQAATRAQAKAAPAAPAPAPSKASREVRAQAERLEPLARAAFWASQVDADPKDAEAGVKLASALRVLGRFPEAQAAAEAVLVQQPNNLDALLESARNAVAAGQGFYAVEPTKKALEIAPKDWRAATLLAVALDQALRPAEAMEAHRTAMQLAPDNPAVLSNAAMFFASQGDQAKAETLLRKAAALPGASLQVRQNLALVLGLQGKLEEAERIERENLPPQMAEANLDYFKAASKH